MENIHELPRLTRQRSVQMDEGIGISNSWLPVDGSCWRVAHVCNKCIRSRSNIYAGPCISHAGGLDW